MLSMRRRILIGLCIYFVICLISEVNGEEEDFYQTLGLTSRTISVNKIKSMFNSLSSTHRTTAQFKALKRAYEVLSDKEKRRVYDERGTKGVIEYEQRGMHRDNRQQGRDSVMEFKVSLEEIYRGEIKQINYARNQICGVCKGTGAKGAKTIKCPHCQGRGLMNVHVGGGMYMQQHCQHCGGQGKTYKEHCPVCRGQKVVRQRVDLIVDIEKGMPEGEQIIYFSMGEEHPSIKTGNLVLIMKQAHNKQFTRDRYNLKTSISINLKEALLGYKTYIQHLDGRKVEISHKGVTQPDSVITIQGEGMPMDMNPKQKGDLFVIVHIKLPKQLSESNSDILGGILKTRVAPSAS